MIVDIRADQSRLNVARADPPGAAPVPGYDVEPFALADFDPEPDAAIEAPRGRWIVPALALLATLCWIGAIGAYLWLRQPMLLPGEVMGFVAGAAAIPTLIGIAWLLLLRTSRAEARRFGHVAEAMRNEALRLEERMAAITRSLALSRNELAAQADQLAVIGDAASERMAAVGRQLGDDIARADDHARRLAEAAGAAQASVGVLLASLPRTQSDTETLTAALDHAAQLTHRHVDALAAEMMALAERGRDAERAVGSAAGTLAGHLGDMSRASEAGAVRLEGAAGAMAATVDTLIGRTADTLDEARSGIERQAEAMLAMVGAHREALDAAASHSAEQLAERINGVEAAVERLASRLEAQRIAGDAMVAGLESGLARTGERMSALHEQGVERSQLLAASISALGGSADAMAEALRAGEAMATRTIGTTETLLIALDSATREIDETLPDALARLDSRITQSKGVVVAAKPELLALVTAAESTHDAIEAIAGVIHDQRRTLEQLSANLIETLSTGRAKADALGQMFDETLERSHRFAEDAAPRLIEALLRVRETAAAAADHARATLATVIPEASDSLADAAARAMSAATSDTVTRQIDAIAEASDVAVAAATRATERLAGQVRQLTEQTAIVEARIEDERTERDNADRDNLSRRVSLLIESLNSASIDITRAFSPDIADSAWTAYLKGDRGVFTRRAVRILDAGEARDVARLYDADAGFRDQVNRYIHDFEAMLRQILAQRHGSSLGVTLLSSDMGKLYVALAQAIERLR